MHNAAMERIDLENRMAWRWASAIMAVVHNASPNARKAMKPDDFYPDFPKAGPERAAPAREPVAVPFRALKTLLQAKTDREAAEGGDARWR